MPAFAGMTSVERVTATGAGEGDRTLDLYDGNGALYRSATPASVVVTEHASGAAQAADREVEMGKSR